MHEASSPEENGAWRVVVVGLVVLALAAVAYLLWSSWDREALLAWKREAGPVRFFIAMALLPAVGVPLSPFSMVAGAIFGVRVGMLGSALALAAHLTLCHRVAVGSLRPRFAATLRRYGQLPDFRQQAHGALRFTLLAKLAPGIPGAAKNYLLGLAGVPFWTYFAVSMLLNGSLGIALVLLGESLFEHDLRLVGWVVAGLALAAALAVYVQRRRTHQ